jgi:hypothetical protein
MSTKDILIEMDAILNLILQTPDGWEQLKMMDSVVEKAESIADEIFNGPEMLINMKSERDQLRLRLNKTMN